MGLDRAVEEVLRFPTFRPSPRSPAAGGIVRYANTSFQVADVMIRAGEMVGLNACPGAGLARLELRELFPTLFRRFPGLRLAVDPEELVRPGQKLNPSLEYLPVTWEAA